jgi:hypothetical protein
MSHVRTSLTCSAGSATPFGLGGKALAVAFDTEDGLHCAPLEVA